MLYIHRNPHQLNDYNIRYNKYLTMKEITIGVIRATCDTGPTIFTEHNNDKLIRCVFFSFRTIYLLQDTDKIMHYI